MNGIAKPEAITGGVSRRALIGTVAALGMFASIPRIGVAASNPTPRQIVEAIRAACADQGIVWSTQTVDTFKIGDPDRATTGIVTTFMATLDLMHQAVAAGANFIISHEPIFYNHFDRTDTLVNDPVYRAKVSYAEEHGLTVWRFHDHLHRLRPEPMSTAFNRVMGWDSMLEPEGEGLGRLVDHPVTTLEGLAREIAGRLPTRSLRVIGKPGMPVARIGQSGHAIEGLIHCHSRDALALGAEVREWDSFEYARDADDLGIGKGLIAIAHERGEQDGMRFFVDWLKAVVPAIPVRFIASGEPFRTV